MQVSLTVEPAHGTVTTLPTRNPIARRSPWRSTQSFSRSTFRNLTIKNRIFRSNVSGRFDNYDGSGNQARINWEAKFAQGRRRRDHLVVRARAPARPHRAELRDDRPRRPHPVLARGRQGGARARLQVHPAAQPRRPSARHHRHRVPDRACRRPAKSDPHPRASLRGDDARRRSQRRCRPSPRAHGARARRGSTASSCTAPTATSSRSSSARRSTTGRTSTAARSRTARASSSTIVRAIRARVGRDFHLQMKISAQEFNDAIALLRQGPSGNTLAESVQVCQWLVEAGVDAHPRVDGKLLSASAQSGRGRPARRRSGEELRHDDLERRAHVRQLPALPGAPPASGAQRSGTRRRGPRRRDRGQEPAGRARDQGRGRRAR